MGCTNSMPPGKPGRWKTWRNGDGMTATIRAHLKKYHQKEWESAVVGQQLKAWEECAGMAGPAPTRQHREPFTLKGFHHRLVKWIVVDDQVCNIISFRYSMLLTITICSQLMSSTVPSFVTCCSMAQII